MIHKIIWKDELVEFVMITSLKIFCSDNLMIVLRVFRTICCPKRLDMALKKNMNFHCVSQKV